MTDKKVPQLSEEEKDYILKHRKTKTVPEIARELKRGDATIYQYFKAKGWEPFKNDPQPRHASHPFRKANVRLERFLKACKINAE